MVRAGWNKVNSTLEQYKEKQNEVTKLASYYILDAWAGRLENGLGENSKRNPYIFAAFRVHNQDEWRFLVISAITCYSYLALIEFSNLAHLFSGLCLVVISVDVIMKMFYMGLSTYFSKIWQGLYAFTSMILVIEYFYNIFENHGCHILHCLRPTLFCLRVRSTRTLFLTVRDMGGNLFKVFFPLLFFLLFASYISFVWFRPSLEDHFNTVPNALFKYWILIFTGETYNDLLPDSVLNSFSYISLFFLVLIFGNMFLLAMLFAVIFEAFKEETKSHFCTERLKEMKGLLKAFSILDENHSGYISEQTFNMVLSHLNSKLNSHQHLLYFELTAKGNGEISLLHFLNLRSILSYEFTFNENVFIKMLGISGKRTAITRMSLFKRYISDTMDAVYALVSTTWYSKVASTVAFADFLSLLFMHTEARKYISWVLWLLVASHFLLLICAHGKGFWKNISLYGKIAFVALLFQVVFGGCEYFLVKADSFLDDVHQEWMKDALVTAAQLMQLFRCTHLIELNKNLQQYIGCLFHVFPSLFELVSFALVIAYFFAMSGMDLFGTQVEYFKTPTTAILSMVQIFFGADVMPIVEETQREGTFGAFAIPFFACYFIVGVVIAFNLINALIIEFYGQTMESSSQQHLAEQRREDQKLQVLLSGWVKKRLACMQIEKKAWSQKLSDFKIHRKDAHLNSGNVQRRLTGNTSFGLHKSELEKLHKYARKIGYKVDLIHLYEGKLDEGNINGKDAEKEIYFSLVSGPNKESTTRRNYVAGEMIIQLGQIENNCYIVHEGIVDVRYQGTLVKSLEKGNLFGTTTMLSSMPSPFTYSAQQGVTLISFNRAVFLNVFDTDLQGKFAALTVQAAIEIEAAKQKIGREQMLGEVHRTFNDNQNHIEGTAETCKGKKKVLITPKSMKKKKFEFPELEPHETRQKVQQHSAPKDVFPLNEKENISTIEFQIHHSFWQKIRQGNPISKLKKSKDQTSSSKMRDPISVEYCSTALVTSFCEDDLFGEDDFDCTAPMY